jgi:hypothetical protein
MALRLTAVARLEGDRQLLSRASALRQLFIPENHSRILLRMAQSEDSHPRLCHELRVI